MGKLGKQHNWILFRYASQVVSPRKAIQIPKDNNEFTRVNTPSLSIALTGTPNQVTGLIASSEDGLFSRFLFYAFKVELRWKDVSPNANNINLTEHFKDLSDRVFNMVQFLQRKETIIYN